MNVVICVASAIVRVGLCAIVDQQPGMRILDNTDNFYEACSLASRDDTDVVIIDDTIASQPSALERLVQAQAGNAHKGAMLVAVTDDTRPPRLRDLLRRGVRGIVFSGEPQQQLVDAVRAAADRAIYVSPSLAEPVAGAVAADDPAARPYMLDKLTPRELEIVKHVIRGLSNQEVAHRLTVSEKTVKFHVSSVLAKLAVRSRAELIATVANLAENRAPDPGL
jgi:DNA-binding NarL/FixJ family response regulator